MGVGGNLMWTALAREIYNIHQQKVVFIENGKIVQHDIFKNSPYISFSISNNTYKLYFKHGNLLPERITDNKWNVSQHTIVSRCNYYGIKNPKIQCNLFFFNQEVSKIQSIIQQLPKEFIVIEPHAKTSWCQHKQYPISKWQNIVNCIHSKIPIVQMSIPGKKVLNNVIDISKKISNFREACLLLKYCKLFISTEGGLMHGCNAVNTPCIIIFAPLFDPKFTKYNNVIDIWVKDTHHYNCFKEGRCDACLKLMDQHNEQEVIDKINQYISDKI